MKFKLLPAFILLATVLSCSKRENESYGPDVIKDVTIPFNARFSNPAPANRTDSGIFHFQILEDNTLRYVYEFKNLAGDQILGATLNAGDPITNGSEVLDLTPRGGGFYGTNVLRNVRNSLIDSLVAGTADIYLNVKSATSPAGLARGQLNDKILMAADVQLNGSNEVPAVNTTATGTALIRLTAHKNLYSLVTVTGLEAADQLSAANIYRGEANANGPVLVPLATSGAEFGVPKVVVLEDNVFNSLLNNPAYVSVLTTLNTAGKIRGQLK